MSQWSQEAKYKETNNAENNKSVSDMKTYSSLFL